MAHGPLVHIFIFSRTTGPISAKLGTKHPLVKEIQVCSNEGPYPFPRGYDNKIGKFSDKIHKIFLTTGPILIKFGMKHHSGDCYWLACGSIMR